MTTISSFMSTLATRASLVAFSLRTSVMLMAASWLCYLSLQHFPCVFTYLYRGPYSSCGASWTPWTDSICRSSRHETKRLPHRETLSRCPRAQSGGGLVSILFLAQRAVSLIPRAEEEHSRGLSQRRSRT